MFGLFSCGRSDRTRTCGILLPKQTRYQLRHTPIGEVLNSFLSCQEENDSGEDRGGNDGKESGLIKNRRHDDTEDYAYGEAEDAEELFLSENSGEQCERTAQSADACAADDRADEINEKLKLIHGYFLRVER